MPLWLIPAWLVLGVVFTYWFVNYFLVDQRWEDTGEKPGAGTLFSMVLFGPGMALVMFVIFTTALFLEHTGPTIQRFFNIKD